MKQIFRRAFLKGAPVAAVAASVPAYAVAEAETPVQKVNRLGWELAHALNEYADGRMHAEIYPSAKRELAVGFMFDFDETQEEKVQRIIRMLQHEMRQLPKSGSIRHLDLSGGRYLRLAVDSEEDSDLFVGFVPRLPKGGAA